MAGRAIRWHNMHRWVNTSPVSTHYALASSDKGLSLVPELGSLAAGMQRGGHHHAHMGGISGAGRRQAGGAIAARTQRPVHHHVHQRDHRGPKGSPIRTLNAYCQLANQADVVLHTAVFTDYSFCCLGLSCQLTRLSSAHSMAAACVCVCIMTLQPAEHVVCHPRA